MKNNPAVKSVQYDITMGSNQVGIITHYEDGTSSMSFEPLSPVEQADFVLSETAKMAEQYIIRRNGSYFRPNAAGYTTSLLEAGLYSREDAESFQTKDGTTAVRFGDCLHAIEDELATAETRVRALKEMKACIKMHHRQSSAAAESTS